MSLAKKLKRMKLDKDNIEILFEKDISQSELEAKYLELTNKKIKEEVTDNTKTNLYYFLNKKTGESIASIYPDLDPAYIKNYNDYERTSKEDLERNWNKTK